MEASSIARLTPFFEDTSLINVVIETPRGLPFKLKYDEKAGVFRAHKAMPVGFEFPFNFGFVPGTTAGDGDPLDVIPAGTVVVGRIIALLEGEQVERKRKERNDRLIALPWDLVAEGPMLPEISFDQSLKTALIDFFTKYNEAQGKQFRAIQFASAQRGTQLTREAMNAANHSGRHNHHSS